MSKSRKRKAHFSDSEEEDDSDAGSLEDFIVNDHDSDGEFLPEDEEASESSETSESSDGSESDNDDVDAKNVLGSPRALKKGELRRSRRTRKVPDRYIDEDYVRLMTDDADVDEIFGNTDDDVSVESEDEEAPNSNDQEKRASSAVQLEKTLAPKRRPQQMRV